LEVNIQFQKATTTDASRLRQIRLAALKDAPYAYGAKYEVEKDKAITVWEESLELSNWFFASIDGEDIGLIGIEKAGVDRLSVLLDFWLVDCRAI